MNGRRRWIEAMAGGVNFRGSFLLIITQRLAAHTHTHTHTHTGDWKRFDYERDKNKNNWVAIFLSGKLLCTWLEREKDEWLDHIRLRAHRRKENEKKPSLRVMASLVNVTTGGRPHQEDHLPWEIRLLQKRRVCVYIIYQVWSFTTNFSCVPKLFLVGGSSSF
jgi:hypothetical protein